MASRLPAGGRFCRAALLRQSYSRHATSTPSGLTAPLASPLSEAASELRLPLLAACHSGRVSSKVAKATRGSSTTKKVEKQVNKSDYKKLIESLGGSRDGQDAYRDGPRPETVQDARPVPAALPEQGDWSEVRSQAEAVSAWPSHLLEAKEKLSLASAFVSQVETVLGPLAKDVDLGTSLCILYERLCESGPLIRPRNDDMVYAGVVVADSKASLGAASREVVSLLLRGHAVSLAAPRGETLEMVRLMTDGFPPTLLQAVEAGPIVTLPAMVHTFRSIGCDASELWADRAPPADFGNFGPKGSDGIVSHGMAAAASSLMLAQTNLSMLEQSSKPRFELNKEVESLTQFMPSRSSPSQSSASIYNRGIGQVQNLLDLLWVFRDSAIVGNAHNPVVSLVAAHKHLILTGHTIPEDMVKAAIVAAMSPFQEKVTLHAVGLGAKGLLRDPMLSFCRLVQSGSSGLNWRIKEHKDWSSFHTWLHENAADEPEPPQLFSTRRQLEIEIRRSCAAAGGVAWTRLFVQEPFEELCRWTSVSEEPLSSN